VRKLLFLVAVVAVALLFVQPVRAYLGAQSELEATTAKLEEAKAAKQAMLERRDALGTRAALIEEARRRGYIFPGETPFAATIKEKRAD
jgi:cell division protein FtsB